MSSIVLKIRRGETPFYRRLRDTAQRVRSSTLPLPGFANPLLRSRIPVQQDFMQGFRWAVSYFVYQPLFRARCRSVGKTVSRLANAVCGGARQYHHRRRRQFLWQSRHFQWTPVRRA